MERDKYLGKCPYTDDECIFDLTDDTDCSECPFHLDEQKGD